MAILAQKKEASSITTMNLFAFPTRMRCVSKKEKWIISKCRYRAVSSPDEFNVSGKKDEVVQNILQENKFKFYVKI